MSKGIDRGGGFLVGWNRGFPEESSGGQAWGRHVGAMWGSNLNFADWP